MDPWLLPDEMRPGSWRGCTRARYDMISRRYCDVLVLGQRWLWSSPSGNRLASLHGHEVASMNRRCYSPGQRNLRAGISCFSCSWMGRGFPCVTAKNGWSWVHPVHEATEEDAEVGSSVYSAHPDFSHQRRPGTRCDPLRVGRKGAPKYSSCTINMERLRHSARDWMRRVRSVYATKALVAPWVELGDR